MSIALVVSRSKKMGAVEQALIEAQHKAEELFAQVIDGGMIRAGILESELSAEIYALASQRFGVRRHWHKRIVRCGPNTMLTYQDTPPDRRIAGDDVVYLDFGPVFEEWEADFGRTYALGEDPLKHKLVADISAAFSEGKRRYLNDPDITAGELYDFVYQLAIEAGWSFGALSAGHLIGRFPHKQASNQTGRFSIRSGNDLKLRELDENSAPRHWILEIHFIDRTNLIGGFFEELLSIGSA